MSAELALNGASLKVRNQWIVKPLSLTIDAGQTVALVGESGAGKSSLLELLRQAHADRVAWCPQQPALVPMLSLYLNVYMGRLHEFGLWQNLSNLLRADPDQWRSVQALADELGLLNGSGAKRMSQSAERFSGGEQQRINIARALFQQRPIFLGDEPVSAVDEVQARRIIERVKAHHQTTVLALHDVDLALACADRIIGMSQGEVVLDRPARALDAETLLALYPSQRHG
ncbi:ATP-binding cassette domain-containing protein [Ferrimonas sediminicola]|uniref:ATP-binding cassette domain-containing protein n=1 Tax=Ferrimonas sediminicola TaxID=2569538 RepID=A0A4U1BA85_9GAMM|nr:ATP-binding cassette domain-containing protein [Ferrimonas sediminicola]TKB47325.1 ATP-binding cassette domain-containing protein [Ferrimonas sediminicola]